MENIKNIGVEKLFDDKYEVPIYQRNYAWKSKQIEQLMDDVLDIKEISESNYYIGTLIVNKRGDVYEVVDGQQRLTTIFLIMLYLGMKIDEVLRFEAREKSNHILRELYSSQKKDEIVKGDDHEISIGYETVHKLFDNKGIDKDTFKEKLKKVRIVRVQVPINVDLNHYFEIMNTRGEQLELHEIAKSKFLEKLSDKDKVVASLIWESCMNMNSYIHMNMNSKHKSIILTEDRDEFADGIESFDTLVAKLEAKEEDNGTFSLGDFFNNPEEYKKKKEDGSIYEDEDRGSKRFESIIGFPQFLLHVNAVMNNEDENESSLDDKRLLVILKPRWETPETTKEYIFNLLKYRLLFDKYIIKRDKKLTEEGKWSLMRSKKYSKKNSVYYAGTFNDSQIDDETLNEKYDSIQIAKNYLTLQSALRITYTSPKMMHWITVILHACGERKTDVNSLLTELENYAVSKVKKSRYGDKTNWFDYQRIVFSYLDYVLYRDGYSYEGKEYIRKQPDFEFQFRSSIEHFYPQHPVNKPVCPNEILNDFGNLALITISGNSKISNLDPVSKKNTYNNVIEQSLKLKIMAELVGNDSESWIDNASGDNNIAKKHGQEMFKILDCEIADH
ncbi:hypothetical protein Ccar_03610 [Clostridium carboxidivorans P7]|uniref:DUF262 domain-containing protein n=1 Tax=Clostridium carboxidivorans TaxID=217159 RepID=UPI000560608A|nr:DUF262 domain-containing protein [Clostridium carboxidivorans]AKN34106.1 hypothetical protein Ccar_03610 [Clostridium carboxidivorans P7]